MSLLPILGLGQTGKVGINTEEPTEVLDINGNGRVRNLTDASTVTDSRTKLSLYTRNVVSKTDGTLGWANLPKALYSNRNFPLPGDEGKRRVTVDIETTGYKKAENLTIISNFRFPRLGVGF